MQLSNFPSLKEYPGLREQILEKGDVMEFPAGTTILEEGSYIKVIPLLLDGLIKIYKEDESGNEVLLYYIKEGESCVMSFTTFSQNVKSTVKAVVEEDSRIFVLPAEAALEIAKKHSSFNSFFYKLFQEKYSELLHIIQVLTFSNKDKRLLDYLNMQGKHKNSNVLHTTHQKIADDLGTPREVISRLLKKLEFEGYLSTKKGAITLKG